MSISKKAGNIPVALIVLEKPLKQSGTEREAAMLERGESVSASMVVLYTASGLEVKELLTSARGEGSVELSYIVELRSSANQSTVMVWRRALVFRCVVYRERGKERVDGLG